MNRHLQGILRKLPYHDKLSHSARHLDKLLSLIQLAQKESEPMFYESVPHLPHINKSLNRSMEISSE